MRQRVLALGLAAAMVAAATIAAGLVAMTPGAARAAQPFTMRTDATYRVEPDAHRTRVSVTIVFTNTTPDAPMHFSQYRTIPLVLQAGVTAVAARDPSGALAVTISAGDGQTLATIRLRSALRYRRAASITLTYRIADGANPDVRIRPSMVVLPIWCFGTSGSVAVQLPDGFTTRVSGSPMSSSSSAAGVLLTSGGVSDPAHWRALLTAVRQLAYTTVTRSIPLSGGTVDLRVRAWSDDAAWGRKTLALAAAALPRLQQVIGLPYESGGPLVLTEALPAGLDSLDEAGLGARDVSVAFNARPFTLLHQLAHVWIGGDLVSSRWIREGLASLAAARIAGSLKVKPPYDPAVEASTRGANAFPLDDWDASVGAQAEPNGSAGDTWAYAAAWALMERLDAQAGDGAPIRALRRAAAGTSPYQAGEPDAPNGSSPRPLDSRQLLDQLEEESGADLSPAFRTAVFDQKTATLLAFRAGARTALRGLLDAAGPLGAPQPVVTALERWQFAEANAAIAQARTWLAGRDALVDRAEEAGLTTPGRLAAGWRSDGGGTRARAELAAELALVDAYLAVHAGVDEPNPVESLGLAGGPRPTELIATAAGLYAAGDLDGAVAAIKRASELDAGAQATGVVRLGILAALVAVIALLVAVAARRVRLLAAWRARRGLVVPPPSA
jgi:hypothetical protein